MGLAIRSEFRKFYTTRMCWGKGLAASPAPRWPGPAAGRSSITAAPTRAICVARSA